MLSDWHSGTDRSLRTCTYAFQHFFYFWFGVEASGRNCRELREQGIESKVLIEQDRDLESRIL